MTGFKSKKDAALDEEGMYLVHPLVFSDFVPPQPAQEPVEDVMLYHDDGTRIVRIAAKRPWVGLTDAEIEDLFQSAAGADEETHIRFALLIQAKLKEKNA